MYEDAANQESRHGLSGKDRVAALAVRLRSPLVGAALLFCFFVSFILLLHFRIGIVDIDGYAYIMGARGLHEGLGYRSLTGVSFNTWPPEYSLLIIPFQDTIRAAEILNYLSFGIAVALLYYLLRRLEWSWQAALGLSAVLGSGFFRLLASVVHADILTYALFFLSLVWISRHRGRTLAGLIWALLVPVKLIAVVFLPASFIADKIDAQKDWKRLLKDYALTAVLVATSIVGLMIFNLLTTGIWSGGGHPKPSLTAIVQGAKLFLVSIPRAFLFGWYGSVYSVFSMAAFVVCITLSIVALVSLRPTKDGRWLRIFGISALVSSGLLLCIRAYDPSVRLLGYGLIAVLIGFRPAQWGNKVWIFYGLAALVTGIVNALTTNSLGDNDPRYRELAAAVRFYYDGSGVVATNSFHILDLHANIPSEPIKNSVQARPFKQLLWVTLPRFDATATSVWPIPVPGKEWCEERHFSGGVLFAHCRLKEFLDRKDRRPG